MAQQIMIHNICSKPVFVGNKQIPPGQRRTVYKHHLDSVAAGISVDYARLTICDHSASTVIPPVTGGVTAEQVNIALAEKADKTVVDALIINNATDQELASVKSDLETKIDQHPDIAISKATPPVRSADGSIVITYTDGSTTVISAPTAAVEAKDSTPTAGSKKAVESGGVFSELEKKILKSDIATPTEVDAGTNEKKLINVVELKRTLAKIDMSGEVVSPFADTFAALPAIPSPSEKFWTLLKKDDIGSGTKAKPQYPSGIYLNDGAGSWSFSAQLGVANVLELLEAWDDKTNTTDYEKFGLSSFKLLDIWINKKHLHRVYKNTPSSGSISITKAVIENGAIGYWCNSNASFTLTEALNVGDEILITSPEGKGSVTFETAAGIDIEGDDNTSPGYSIPTGVSGGMRFKMTSLTKISLIEKIAGGYYSIADSANENMGNITQTESDTAFDPA